MSLEWNDEQTHILIDERKNGNGEYHWTPKRNKRIFWKKIAEKLNEVNNSNYFTGKACNKKFLSLTRAYYVSLWFICFAEPSQSNWTMIRIYGILADITISDLIHFYLDD